MRERFVQYYLAMTEAKGGRHYDAVWLSNELTNILACLQWAYRSQQWQVVVNYVASLDWYLGNRGFWRERIESGQMAVEAAKRLNSHSDIAHFHLMLAWTLQKQGDLDSAEQHAQVAKAWLEGSSESRLLLKVYSILTEVALSRDDMAGAKTMASNVLEIADEINQEYAFYDAYCDLGDVSLNANDLDEAESLYTRALRGYEALNNVEEIASRSIDLGNVMLLKEQLDEAHRCFVKGLTLSQRVGRQDNIGYAQFGLACVEEKARNYEEAMKYACLAYDTFDRLVMKRHLEKTKLLLSRLALWTNPAAGHAA